jgi:hypothetical protein
MVSEVPWSAGYRFLAMVRQNIMQKGMVEHSYSLHGRQEAERIRQ